jgi:hypothetical protein
MTDLNEIYVYVIAYEEMLDGWDPFLFSFLSFLNVLVRVYLRLR